MRSLVDVFFNLYRNEKNTCRLLPFNEEIISELRSEISRQLEFIEETKDFKQLKAIYEQELENIKYFLADYIKVRLDKIHKNLYLDESLMSENERLFYKKLKEQYKKLDIYVEQTEKYQDFECVGFIAQTDIGNVLIEGDSVDISDGDFFVVKLTEVDDLLQEGKILLV